MGNYFPSLPYINYGYQPENNNTMDASVLVNKKEADVVPKISNYLNLVDVSTVNRLQNMCKKDSSVMMTMWNKVNYYTSPVGAKNSCEENGHLATLVPTCERPCTKDCESESGNSISFRLNSKKSQNIAKQSPDLVNFHFQRIGRRFEDTPYSCRTRTKIDLDYLYLTTVIRMPDNQQICLKEDLTAGIKTTPGRYRKSICFFIDIKDPLKQKPLCEEYQFSICCDSDSSIDEDCCTECLNEDCDDEDFIVFEEKSSEEGCCGLNFNLSACSPAALSCSVGAFGAYSTEKTCFDISMNTSPVSAKVGFRQSHEKNKTQGESCHFSMNLNSGINCYGCAISRNSSCSCKCTVNVPNVSTNKVNSENSSSKLTTCTDSCDGSSANRKKSSKKVSFQKDENLVVVYQMRHWDFAYREARKGSWELEAVDRCRFWRRIMELEFILGPCLRRKLNLIQKA